MFKVIECDITVKEDFINLRTFKGWAVVVRCSVPGCVAFINGRLPGHSAERPSFTSAEGHLQVRYLSELRLVDTFYLITQSPAS